MTNIELELENWDTIQKRDRLVGVGLFGWMDAVDSLQLSELEEEELLKILKSVAVKTTEDYSFEMRIPKPLLVTTMKPGGTIPQLPTVSSSSYRAFAPFYIRRVRISSSDPLAKVASRKGYPIYPETGQGPDVESFNTLTKFEQFEVLKDSSTWVIEFPVKTESTKRAKDESAIDQLKRYIRFQKYWSDHNTSSTIYVEDDEWDQVVDYIYDNWDDYVAVAFLPKREGVYPLMPYEEISEEEYNRRVEEISQDDLYELLTRSEYSISEIIDSECESGICPVR